MKVVNTGQEIMLISSDGIVIRMNVDDISVMSRNTQGVLVMRTGNDDKVVALAVAEKKADTE